MLAVNAKLFKAHPLKSTNISYKEDRLSPIMHLRMHMLTYILVHLTINRVSSSGSQAESQLIEHLFDGNNYLQNVIPRFDLSIAMDLTIDLSLLGMVELNELEQKLVTSGYLWITWTDELLTWDPDDYDGVYSFHIPQSKVWKPDLGLWNGFQKTSELGNEFVLISVENNGLIKWAPLEIFETQCSIEVKYFPFDEQVCEIIIAPWMMGGYQFNIESYEAVIGLDKYDQNGMWTITETSAIGKYLTDVDYGIVFTIKLKRNSSFYVANLILPVILLSVLSIFTFALPAESGERMGYSLTVFLALAVFMTIISLDLPKSSGSLLSSYLAFELVLNTFVVCFTAFQLRLYHRKNPVPARIGRALSLRCCEKKMNNRWNCCKKRDFDNAKTQKNDTSNSDKHGNIDNDTNQTDAAVQVKNGIEKGEIEKLDKKTVNWDSVISKIDFIFFWLMVLLKVVVISIHMKLLTSH